MPVMSFLDFAPTYATEAVEATVGNSTVLLTSLNTGTKSLAFGYGFAITGASALDAISAKNTLSRCLFGVGCACGFVGTVSTAISGFNNTVGLPVFGTYCGAAAGALYWLGRKANIGGRIVNIPAI
jgi:hypothetical protein